MNALKKVGPYSKQMLNYSYPPLLYQRADSDEEEDEEEYYQEDSQMLMSGYSGNQLPQLQESDDEQFI